MGRHPLDLDTPFAALDLTRVERNIARLTRHLAGRGVALRQHVKTAKSLEVAALVDGGTRGPITVSTLAEAEAFAAAGYTDILYAVGIAPHKLARVVELQRGGVRVTVLLDSLVQAAAVVARSGGVPVQAMIEIDCDGHRGGLLPDDPDMLAVGRMLHDAGCLAGVLVHAGESYFARTPQEQRAAADRERDVAVAAAGSLRAVGIRVDAVSVGSTPTAHAATDLTGVTEVRAGNFVFFDLVMAGIGVCELGDLALSVVVTVIGHRRERGWILTDGGWMAMSRDRGTAGQAVDQGYGLVAALDGTLLPDLVMSGASQEHGVLTARNGAALPDLPVGTRLRILPNHACATAAQHDRYHVLDGTTRVAAIWPRISGW